MHSFANLLFILLLGWCLPVLAVSFELIDRQAQFQSSEQWLGKPTFLFVWKSDCPACQQELAEIMAFAQQKPNAHLILVTIDTWQESIPKLTRLPENLIVLRSVNAESLLRRLSNKSLAVPYTVLLSATHDIRQKHLGVMTQDQMQLWLSSF